MAIKTITGASIAEWSERELTNDSPETIHSTIYIGQPSPLYYFLGSTTSLVPADMITRPMEEWLVTGKTWEALTLPIEIQTTSFLDDPEWQLAAAIPSDVLDRLIYLAALPDNWYMHGAQQINSKAIGKAVHLLLRIVGLGGKQWARPFIAPSPDGGLALRWKTQQGTELHLEIAPDGGLIEYLFVRTVCGSDVEELEGQLQFVRAISHLVLF